MATHAGGRRDTRPGLLAEIRLNQQLVREIMHTAIISADEEASLAEWTR